MDFYKENSDVFDLVEDAYLSVMIVDLNERGEIVGLEIINFSKSGVDLDKIVREGVESAAKI